MQKLKVGEHVHFTDNFIKVLAQNRITTLLDFLQENTEKLANITKLSLPQVLDIRNDILMKYSAPLVSGTSLMQKSIMKRKFVSSGIQSLDAILGGGIPVGYITEFCGLSDSGKTQLCLQIAVNVAKNSDDAVLYVDTKGDFSATRIQKALDACGYSHKEIAQIMFRIQVVHAWTMVEILELFKSIKQKNVNVDNLKLIIIDSLPCLMFQFLGDENKVGLSFLNTLVNYSRYLCKEMDLGIVCVNIQTRWIDEDILDVDDSAEQSTTNKEYTERRNRCLGKYWQGIPALILIMEKSEEKEILVTVIKNFVKKSDQKCTLKISNLGVT